MKNINSIELKNSQNFSDPYGAYSSKELPSFLNKGNKDLNDSKKKINKNNILTDNFQTNISFEKLKYNSLKKNNLKRFSTQNNLRGINVSNQKNNRDIVSDGYNIVFAKKTNMYANNGNLNMPQKKNMMINKDINFKHLINKNNDGINVYKRMDRGNNQKNYSCNNSITLNNSKKNNFLINNNIAKKISDNNIKNNHDLNSTMPNKQMKNYNFDANNLLNSEKILSINQNKSKIQNYQLINNYLLNSQNSNPKRRNKFASSRTMADNKNKNIRNDLSWDYGIGVLNKGQQLNFSKKDYNRNNENIFSNFLTESKKKSNEIDTKVFNDDEDNSDKDIDEIVDNLSYYFNDEKRNNTVILNEKGLSDDSLSDIADDIVKTFNDTENEDINAQETVPSSSYPDLDGVTNSASDLQYSNYHNEKKIVYETKSTVKPTIVNNFFISSTEGQKNNNNFGKDINYNLFVVNEYNNNKINSNIPTLITRTYKSPYILREEKKYKKNNNLNEIQDIRILDDDFTENINNPIANNANKNMPNDKNIIKNLSYNQINNNLINSNILNNKKPNEVYNFNNKFETEPNIIDSNNNIMEQIYKYNINNDQKINDNKLFLVESKNSSINNLKKNYCEVNINNEKLKDFLPSYQNTGNNLKAYKGDKVLSNNSINDIDKTNLLKNKIKKRENIFDKQKKNNENSSFNTNNDNNFINYESNYNNVNTSTNSFSPINKDNNLLNNNNLNTINIPVISKLNDEAKKNILKKTKRNISFNLDNNIFIIFNKDDFITKSRITNQNGQVYNQPTKDMNLYKMELKLNKPKPIIKTFLQKDIKINKDYLLVENLPERQILPDLYDDFEEDEIKSLEKSLEGTVDKILH